MDKLHIGVCCTFGAGSSLMLKMNLDNVFNRLKVDADVVVYDISSINQSLLDSLDAVFTGTALVGEIEGMAEGTKAKIVPVHDYFNLQELEESIKKTFEI
ncbi:MAG: PTS sugar transporter subunit IIB [Erysipelotrichaceae bacterium]|nr:PTS sugar transporter subunit IIB [Solobacterium sp.]MDY4792488.1 PTS sugar transporter subunit IIB [Erysipelotrichaceae bacterium]